MCRGGRSALLLGLSPVPQSFPEEKTGSYPRQNKKETGKPKFKKTLKETEGRLEFKKSETSLRQGVQFQGLRVVVYR